MARKGKTGVLKRLREVKKAEKAALKRDQMKVRRESSAVDEEPTGDRIATDDDMVVDVVAQPPAPCGAMGMIMFPLMMLSGPRYRLHSFRMEPERLGAMAKRSAAM